MVVVLPLHTLLFIRLTCATMVFFITHQIKANRDAYRLAIFARNKKEGMRYKAEQEMKRLLNIDGIASFITWK